MFIFKTASEYIGSCTTLKERIAAIEAIQAGLLIAAQKAAENGDVSQYSLNDGKTIIATSYRDARSVMLAYDSWEIVKNKLINKKMGRMIRLVDKNTFDGSGCH
jgi:hypothetical protein